MHSCRTAQSFTIVLAGETLFVHVPTVALDLRIDAARLSVDVWLVDAPLGAAEPRQVTVDWTGKVQDAIRAGLRLGRSPLGSGCTLPRPTRTRSSMASATSVVPGHECQRESAVCTEGPR